MDIKKQNTLILRNIAAYCSIAILFAIAVIFYYRAILLGSVNVFYTDYGKFYQTVQYYFQHKSLYTPTFCKEFFLSNNQLVSHIHLAAADLNPPFFSWLLLPLGHLRYVDSLWSWAALSALCGIVSICLITKTLNLPAKILTSCALTLALFVYYPTFLNFQFGQISLFLMPFVVVAWGAWREGNFIISAILLAFLTSIKLFFGLFAIYFILNRYWKPLAWYCGVFISCTFLPLINFKFSEYPAYHNVISHIWWYAASGNASFFGFFLHIFGGHGEKTFPLINSPSYLAQLLYFVFSFALLISIFKFIKPVKTGYLANNLRTKRDLDFFVLLVVMFLVSPVSWCYYFLWLTITFIVLLGYAQQGYYPTLLRLGTCGAIILSSLPVPFLKANQIMGAEVILGKVSCGFYSLILLLGMLFFLRYNLNKQVIPSQNKLSFPILLSLYIATLIPSFLGLAEIHHQMMIEPQKIMPYLVPVS